MVSLRKGLDKVLEFAIDDTAGKIGELKVIFAQEGQKKLVKSLANDGVSLAGSVLTVKLSAEDTEKFTAPMVAVVQILVRYKGGSADWTDKEQILVLDVLGGERI